MKKEQVLTQILEEGWFYGVDPDKVRRIVDVSSVKKLKAGEFVYLVGEKQDSVFCVLDGQVRMAINGKEGEEFVLAILGAGRWFGEGAFDSGVPMPLEARVIAEATILSISTRVLSNVLDNGDAFYRNVLHDIIGRSKLLYKLVEILLFKPLNGRMATRMLYLIDMFGKQSTEGIILPLEISQSDFARMSGGSRQRVNQVFRKWSKDGIVTKQDKHYVIHSITALQAEADTPEEA